MVLCDLLSQLINKPDQINSISAVASAIAAIAALFVSGMALWVSYITLKHQRKHDVLSVRPIPAITVADFSDSLRVKIRNHGAGPMLIRRIIVVNGDDQTDSLVMYMPKLPPGVLWTNFAGSLLDRSLLPSSEVVLLQLDGKVEDGAFIEARDAVRKALEPLKVSVEYTDIYGSTFKTYTKALDWFGRHRAGNYPE